MKSTFAKRMIALALVIVTVLSISAVALATAGYYPYLGGSRSSHYLRRGHEGPQVTNLQLMLNAADYDCGEADGIFGSATEDAVEALQGDYGLTVDGIVGGDTKEALWDALDETVPDDCVVIYH